MATATIATLLVHSCPRCRGDLFLDVEELEYACLQCARTVEARRLLGSVTVHEPRGGAVGRSGQRRLYLVPRIGEELDDDAA